MGRARIIVVSAFVIAFAALPATTVFAGGTTHVAITITSNKDFSACKCVTSGSGTASDPYVIGPWTITSPSGGTSGWSVKVDNSKGGVTAFFNIVGIVSNYNDTNFADPDIWFVNVNQATAITSDKSGSFITAASSNGTGIRLDNSSNVTISSVDYNHMYGPGVYINGSSNISINFSKLKSSESTTRFAVRPNTDAVYAVNSSNLQIGMDPNCPKTQGCNDTAYDNGYAYDLVNTHDSVINNAIASADDTGGYLLDGKNTFNVTIENSAVNSIGPVCQTRDGLPTDTGYITDVQGGLMLINGAHDNTFLNDNFNVPGATPLPSIGSGGNGFRQSSCGGWHSVPWTGTVEAPGANNDTFTNVCYSLPTNYPNLPPSARC